MSTDWPPPAFDPHTGELLDEVAETPPAAPPEAPPAAVSNVAEYSVSEISGALKRTLEDTFGHVRVRAELGRVSRPASGHIYLDLKDEKSVLAGVIWKGAASKLKIKPEQGLEVVVTGRITTFASQSKYQIVIDSLEPAGAGALMALLEERRKKLAAEGLFDESRKKQLPYLPDVIGVVTSPTGAVIRDILHRLSDRFPRRVLVWPVRVQGETSAAEVAAGINGFNALDGSGDVPRPDLIIVARGGGSLEDLWGFNEEAVVRAAADSEIPLISAVGHETDWTLVDHAADWRAPTPTAAAEKAVPVRVELVSYVANLAARNHRALGRAMDERKARITSASRGLPRPDDLLALARQRLDNASARLGQSLRAATMSRRSRLDAVAGRLSVRPLKTSITREREAIVRLSRQMRGALGQSIDMRSNRLQQADKLLAAFSYHSVLSRGFALVRDASGQPVRSAEKVNTGDSLDIQFADGRIGAIAGDVPPGKPTRKKPVPASKKKPSGGQGSLF